MGAMARLRRVDWMAVVLYLVLGTAILGVVTLAVTNHLARPSS